SSASCSASSASWLRFSPRVVTRIGRSADDLEHRRDRAWSPAARAIRGGTEIREGGPAATKRGRTVLDLSKAPIGATPRLRHQQEIRPSMEDDRDLSDS